MSAAALIARATAAGVRLWVEGGQVRVRAAHAPAADLLAELRAHRDEVWRLLSGKKLRHDGAVSEDPSPAPRDAWGLSETDKADGIARIFGTQTPPAIEPGPFDHDAAERAAMAAHYAEEPTGKLPPPPRQDELRDGLF